MDIVDVSNFFAHPFILLVTGAIITSILIPWITNRWQDHKKKVEIKVELVSQISEVVSLARANTISIILQEIKPIKTAFDDESKLWLIKGHVVSARLQAYFNDSSISNEWDDVLEALTDFWAISLNLVDRSVPTIDVSEMKIHFPSAKNIDWKSIENKSNFKNTISELEDIIIAQSEKIIKTIIREEIKSF